MQLQVKSLYGTSERVDWIKKKKQKWSNKLFDVLMYVAVLVADDNNLQENMTITHALNWNKTICCRFCSIRIDVNLRNENTLRDKFEFTDWMSTMSRVLYTMLSPSEK